MSAGTWGPRAMGEWAGTGSSMDLEAGGRGTGGGLTWDVDVHGHDAVTAPHDGVGVVVVAAPVGAAAGGAGP